MKKSLVISIVLGGFMMMTPEITRHFTLQYHSGIYGIYYAGTLCIKQKDQTIFTHGFGYPLASDASSQELFNARLAIGHTAAPYQASLVLQIGYLKQEST